MNLPGPSSLAAENATPDGSAERAPRYAWVILAVIFVWSMAAPLNQFKVPPVLPLLIDDLALSLSGAGLLMSVFAITGIFLALPAGFVVQRLGLKATGLIAAACLITGSAMGALSQSSTPLLLSRFVEGLGMGFISITAPSAIAAWFPPQTRGTPMGIWAAWFPAGSLLMYLVAPPLAASGGWRQVWWFGFAFTAAAFVLYALFMRVPPPAATAAQPAIPGGRGLRRTVMNKQVWLLALVFGCFTYAMLAVGTFYPTFLVEERQFTVADAANVLAANNVVVLFSAPFFGWLSDRFGTRKQFFTLPFLYLMLMVPIVFQISATLALPAYVLLGAFTAAIPAVVVTAAPEVMHDPRLVSIGLAVLTIGQNLGMVVGPAVFGLIAEQGSWLAAALSSLPILLLGFVVGRHVRVR